MDPTSVLAIVNGSLDLALKCASVVKSLHDVASKHKYAELSLVSMIDECQTFRLAWGRIQSWAQRQQESTVMVDDQLAKRLCSSLAAGMMVLSALEQDLVHLGGAAAPVGSLGFRRRNKIIWNEQVFRDHQDRLRGQIGAMTLLLEVIKLPTATEQTNLLAKEEHVLRAADESAWTIVNSRTSTSIRDRDSLGSVDSAELIYRRLSCEDDLFTARVYKRNFRNRKIGKLFHQNAKARGKKAAELAPADGPTKDVDADIDTARGASLVPSAQSGQEPSALKGKEWQTFLKTIGEEYKPVPIETENGQVSPVLPEPRTEREAIEFQSWPIFVKEVGEEHKPKKAEIQDGQAFSTLTKPLTEKLTDLGDFDNQYPWQAFLKQAGEKYKSLPPELQGEMEREIEREVYDEQLTNDLDNPFDESGALSNAVELAKDIVRKASRESSDEDSPADQSLLGHKKLPQFAKTASLSSRSMDPAVRSPSSSPDLRHSPAMIASSSSPDSQARQFVSKEQKKKHKRSGSLNQMIEEASRRASREPRHGGLGSMGNAMTAWTGRDGRGEGPFSDANVVGMPISIFFCESQHSYTLSTNVN